MKLEFLDFPFRKFYTRIGNIEKTLGVTRKTASGYLMQLAEAGFLDVEMRGREKLYINRRLIELSKNRYLRPLLLPCGDMSLAKTFIIKISKTEIRALIKYVIKLTIAKNHFEWEVVFGYR